MCYIAHPSVRLSVCLSVTRVDPPKTVEVRIMQHSVTLNNASDYRANGLTNWG